MRIMLDRARFDHRSRRALCTLRCAGRDVADCGFTVIELIGVLTILALLAAAVIPSVIRRIDQAARTRETSDLSAIADAYTRYILRDKIVPDLTTWASSVANYMSLPVSAITNTPRGYARAFLIDPDLRINGNSLPY